MKKKIGLVCVMIMMMLVSTGCSETEKVLDCTKTTNESFITMTENEKITFNGTDITKYEEYLDIELDEAYLEYKDTYISILEEEYDKFAKMNGVTLKMDETDKGLNVSVIAIIGEMSDDDMDLLNVSKKASYDETLKSRTSNEYTCK